MSRLRLSFHAAVAAALLAALPAQAAIPKVLTYSGYVKTAAGVAVTAPTDLTFRLYTVSAAGSAVWTETVSVTPTSDGWFSAVLGTTTPLVLATLDQDLYLSLQVNTDAEFTQRARVTPSGSALTVDWAGVQGKPACAAGQYLTLDPATGNLLCTTPATGTGGLTSVLTAAPIQGNGTSASAVTLAGCPGGGQILQWSGSSWGCIATPTGGTGGVSSVGATAPVTVTGTAAAPVIGMSAASGISSGYITAADFLSFSGKAPSPGAIACGAGQVLTWTGVAFACVNDVNSGGTVTSVGVTSPTPITVTGTTALSLSMPGASATSSGYLSAGDWSIFNAKAPTANPVFTGTVSASTVTATTFVGSLSGNATTATSATTATTATSASSVAPNVITPSDMNSGIGPLLGQVPAKGATDTFTWVSPLAPPTSACSGTQVLTWTGAALACVTDANTTYTAGAGLLLSGTQFAPAFTTAVGRNGAATTVARGDHTHAQVTTVPLADFTAWLGAPTLGKAVLGPAVSLPAWLMATNDCILGAVRIPPGTGGATGTPPVIRVLASASATITGSVQFANSGLVAGAVLPNSHWGAPGSISTTLTAGQLVEVTNSGLSLGSFQVTGSSPAVYAGPGDLFMVRICGVNGMQLVSVMLVWN